MIQLQNYSKNMILIFRRSKSISIPNIELSKTHFLFTRCTTKAVDVGTVDNCATTYSFLKLLQIIFTEKNETKIFDEHP